MRVERIELHRLLTCVGQGDVDATVLRQINDVELTQDLLPLVIRQLRILLHGTMGLSVCAIDIDDGKLAHAKRIGADLVFNAKAGDPAAALKKETGGGAHGVLITAPSLIAFKQGVGMTRKHGTCVLVGLPPGEFPIPLFDVVANCITIRG
jgi:D-arabinose 1-dehydrogenase-like Zn-dependent alcohol dehydrogenase